MVCYIEYVLLDNFVIDYLLLKAAFSVTGKTVKKLRLFLAAALGAVTAPLFPLIDVSAVIVFFLKLLTGVILVFVAAKYNSVKEFYVTALLFVAFTFLAGGAITGIYSLLGLDYSAELSVALMILPVAAIIKSVTAIVKFIYKRKTVGGNLVKCELVFNGKTTAVTGFIDTGNNLYDGDRPVIVCGKGTAAKLMSMGIPKLKFIEYSTVMGRGKMATFRIDGIKVYCADKPNIISNVTIGVAEKGAGIGYGLILHPALIGGNDDIAEKVKEVS